MEELSSEKVINRNEKNKEETKEKIEEQGEEEIKNEEENNEDNLDNNNDDDEDKNKDGEFTTDFAEKIELTEEEKTLRKEYLKKISKKEAIIRSIILGKSSYIIKIFSFVINLLYDIVNFKETKYKSDAINAITSKDLDKFLISIKYHIIMQVINKTLNQIEIKFYDHFSLDEENNNIMLKNLLFKKDMEFFDLFKTGELSNKVQAYQEYPSFNFIETCTQIGQYIFKIGYYGYYLYKDYFEMTAIYFIIMFVQTFSEPFIYNDTDIDDIGEKYELRENYINDILANIRLVKSFGTEKKELKRISNIIDKIREKGFWKKLFQEIYSQLYTINDLLIFYECGRKTISGKMDYGELLIFERYSSEFKSSFVCLKEVFTSIKDGINSWTKFLEIYDIEQKIVSQKDIIPKMEENSNKDKKEAKGLGIDFKNVTFAYPTKKNINIINGLDLKVEPGKTVAIVGSSGSGKTTLTNLLLRFYDVNDGEILINGIDIKDLNLSWLRANIGIVSQEPVLTSGTIRENILYGVDNYTEKKFIEVCKLSNVYSFATDKKLFPKEFDTIVGERGIKVSGGQKQRIAIARALMKDAKILIFDEATSALDSENEALVQEAINNVINQKKITTIIIAHRLSTVKNANVIYVMNYGKIVEFGTHDELIEKNGEYKKLIYRQLVSVAPQK